MAVPDAFPRDTMDRTLLICQNFLGSMEVGDVREVSEASRVAVAEDESMEITVEKVMEGQKAEYGRHLEEVAQKRDNWIVGEDGLLYQVTDVGRIIVPEVLREEVVRSAHGRPSVGHWEVVRTAARIRKRYCLSGWTQDVQMFVQSCLACSLARMQKPSRHCRMQVYHPSGRFELVAIDVLKISPASNGGNKKVIVMGDLFTRFMMAIPVRDETAATISRVLLELWVLLFGPLKKLLSDLGKAFSGDVIRHLCAQVGTKNIFTSAYHPQTDGCVERFNRTLCNDIAKFVLDEVDWDQHVYMATFRYNMSFTGPLEFLLIVSCSG
jgi:transposase InsO family protein